MAWLLPGRSPHACSETPGQPPAGVEAPQPQDPASPAGRPGSGGPRAGLLCFVNNKAAEGNCVHWSPLTVFSGVSPGGAGGAWDTCQEGLGPTGLRRGAGWLWAPCSSRVEVSCSAGPLLPAWSRAASASRLWPIHVGVSASPCVAQATRAAGAESDLSLPGPRPARLAESLGLGDRSGSEGVLPPAVASRPAGPWGLGRTKQGHSHGSHPAAPRAATC